MLRRRTGHPFGCRTAVGNGVQYIGSVGVRSSSPRSSDAVEFTARLTKRRR